MQKLGWCKCCAERVSNEADNCPRCGQPQPYLNHNPKMIDQGQFQTEVQIGEEYKGRVTKIIDFAVWVQLPNGEIGLLPSSRMILEKSKEVSENFLLGDLVAVKIFSIHEDKIALSLVGWNKPV